LELDFDILIDRCIQKKRGADERLFKALYPKMMPLCMSYVKCNDDAVEVFNQAFFKIHSQLKSHKRDKAFLGWCRRITVNCALDHIRKNERWKKAQPLDHVAQPVSISGSALEQLKADDILSLFRRLSPRLRAVANLYMVEGYSHSEIAEKLDMSVGTSKWSLNQARRKLQDWIQKEEVIRKSI
jgi:RNA polymerase sigma factor (sigma-70 family)